MCLRAEHRADESEEKAQEAPQEEDVTESGGDQKTEETPEEEATGEEEEAPAEEEEEEEEEEVVDPKPEIEATCKPRCVKQLLSLQVCYFLRFTLHDVAVYLTRESS